ncbi:uncharacterized protein TM35_000013320 [Trypanosoma theileri]|uniref:Uncharacterized protein n=1 Tax=Trypanosoma theileri TaxID=67003 RepID=A0A1X0P9E6_9TRYP|nr:uncharacterized protein TM35_000013320 [Trypanosoma theileri]ORC93455.1 hypothetical protein TM35_000013320 [Trypanosoma theileri]
MHALRENARGVESVIRDVGVSLHQYRGPDGLRLLMEQGKLSILSAFGEFRKSNDEIYNSRMKVVSRTRSAIMKLSDQFDAVGNTITTLTTQLDELFAGLQRFTEVCEKHLEGTNVEPADFSELSNIRSSSTKIRVLGHDLASNIKTNSCGIHSSSLEQIDSIYSEVKCEVSRAQTIFDVQRRQVEVSESELAKIQDLNPDRARMAEYKHRRSLETLQGGSEQYHAALQSGMEKTSFVLEQASMATWSASNVFFLQLSMFFKDLFGECEKVAGILANIKNNRKVSQRINSEKRAAANAATQKVSVKEKVSENVPSDYELVDMFTSQSSNTAQPNNNPSPSLIVQEDTVNRGARESIDIDDIFK